MDNEEFCYYKMNLNIIISNIKIVPETKWKRLEYCYDFPESIRPNLLKSQPINERATFTEQLIYNVLTMKNGVFQNIRDIQIPFYGKICNV